MMLQGVPTLVDVKGLQLNTSMDGDPAVSAQQLLVRDWGRFQSPQGSWEECPYKRAAPMTYHCQDQSGPDRNQSHEVGGGISRALLADDACQHPGGGAPSWDPNAMMSALVDQSIVNCFTWVLFQQGKLDRYLVGDEVPNKVLFTDTWLLIVPRLVWDYPGRRMGLLAHVSAPPDTAIKAAKGISSRGNATLAFYLDDEGAADQGFGKLAGTLPHHDGVSDAEFANTLKDRTWDLHELNMSRLLTARKQAGARGKHLFTLGVGGELVAKDVSVEPDVPLRPSGFRLRVTMEIVKDSLSINVVQSDVGDINEDRLRTIGTLAAFLVEAKINNEILKDGFPLPDIPHVQVVKPGVQVVDYALSLDSSVQYVP